MPNYATVNRYLEERLCDSVAGLLNSWHLRLISCNYHDPTTGYFHPGTVRAVVASQLQRHVASRSSGKWLVLTQQPYPETAPDGQLIDLWVQGPREDQRIAIMIETNFDLDRARVAYEQLADLSPRHFDRGVLIFCAEKIKVADWQEEIETNKYNRVLARGIWHRPEVGGRRRYRRGTR